MNVQFVQIRSKDIAFKINISANESGVYFVDQGFTFHHVNIHGEVLFSFILWVDFNLGHASVFNLQRVEESLGTRLYMVGDDRQFFFCIGNSYISTGLDMSIQQCIKIKVYGDVGIGQNNVFLFLGFQECQNTCQSINTSVVHTNRFFSKRRNNIQTAFFTGKIPLTSGSQMIHQRIIVVAYQYGNIVNSAVNHTGKNKVDHTITACKRNGSHQTLAYQLRYQGVITVWENNTQCICV